MAASELDPYAAIAPFYDLDLEGFDGDLGLYLGLARRSSRPILELGCGSGRVALALARAGHWVAGIDRSTAMLALARRRLAAEPELRLALVQADMRRFAFAGRFGLIAIPLDGFLHLESQTDQLACLRCARGQLARGGLLAIDLPGPASPGWEDWSPGVRPLVLVWSRSLPDGACIGRYSSFSADAARQTHHVREIYERIDRDGTLRRWPAAYTLRYVFPAELELLLAAAGLRIRARYGDYDLAPFSAGSARQIVVAEAAARAMGRG